jgi:carboxynorspermidine decarboxylase
MTLPHLPKNLYTPAYIIDMAMIRRNLEVVTRLKAATGVKVLLALKAFSQFSAFAPMQEVLDGVTCSGIHEAQLGHDYFGKEIHVYAPAFRDWEITELLPIAHHLTFNSLSQWQRYAPQIAAAHPHIQLGLRLNPEISLAGTGIYDPCAPCSRLGIKQQALLPVFSALAPAPTALHVHALCQNLAEASAALIDRMMEQFGTLLPQVSSLNLGGGHYLTDPHYDLELLIAAIHRLQKAHPHLTLYLEPGGALVLNAGWLVTRVLDIIPADATAPDSQAIAILDTSATAHMPDVLEMPYRPEIIGAALPNEKPHTYLLGAPTCLAGDVIGAYSFDAPLQIGDKLFFTDMAQYSFVKNTTFNGIPLPDIALLHEDGRYEVAHHFGYEDFRTRLS